MKNNVIGPPSRVLQLLCDVEELSGPFLSSCLSTSYAPGPPQPSVASAGWYSFSTG